MLLDETLLNATKAKSHVCSALLGSLSYDLTTKATLKGNADMTRIKVMFAQVTDTIQKTHPASHYHKLPNHLARSGDLSDKAFRILVHMLSFSSDFQIRKSYLSEFFGVTERTVQKYISELRDRGYITYINEHDDNGNFAGGYYVLFETPIQTAANDFKVERMTPERRRKKLEDRRRKQQAEEAKILKTKPANDPEVKPASIYRACMKRLAKRYELSSSDRDSLALSFQSYMQDLQGKLYANRLYDWLENGLKQRLSTQHITARIRAAKNQTADSHIERESAKANRNKAHAEQHRQRTPTTTEEKLTDTSWDKGDCYLNKVDDFLELTDSENNPFPEDDLIPN